MWDQTLCKIDKDTPKKLIERWTKESLEVNLISKGVNLVYKFQIPSKTSCYIRITHQKLRLKNELEDAISFQNHLYDNSVPVCKPILSLNNSWTESCKQGTDIFLASVCEEVPGKTIEFNSYKEELYYLWGEALGKFHNSSKTFPSQNYNYTSWEQSIEELYTYIHNEPKKIREKLDQVSNFFSKRKVSSSNFGLTHGDHREGNIITDGRRIHFIDFDLPSLNWFTEDFFRPFFQSIIHNDYSWKKIFLFYLNGYKNTHLSHEINEEVFIHHFLLKSLEIYLWTKNNWSETSAPGNLNRSKWLESIYKKLVSNTTDLNLELKPSLYS